METKKNIVKITLTPEEREKTQCTFNTLARTPRKKSQKEIAAYLSPEQIAKRVSEKWMRIVNQSLEGLPNQ